MVRPREDNGDGSFSVTPQALRDTAALFQKASQDTFDLEISLNTDVQQLKADMATIFSDSPDALERFYNRWQEALLHLSDSLQMVGSNLVAAADGYQMTDTHVSDAFDAPKKSGAW